jgi:hypothetical protein
MSRADAELPDGAIARITVFASGVEVNLREGMSAAAFAEMLRAIADAYEAKTIRRTR